MQRYFFTFGTASHFPYGLHEFVEVDASSEARATNAFRQVYPDYSEDTVNCAFIYDEKEFSEIKDKYYKDVKASDIIVDMCLDVSRTDEELYDDLEDIEEDYEPDK